MPIEKNGKFIVFFWDSPAKYKDIEIISFNIVQSLTSNYVKVKYQEELKIDLFT